MLLCTKRHTVIEQLNNRKDFESSIEYQGINLEAKHPRSGTVGLEAAPLLNAITPASLLAFGEKHVITQN